VKETRAHGAVRLNDCRNPRRIAAGCFWSSEPELGTKVLRDAAQLFCTLCDESSSLPILDYSLKLSRQSHNLLECERNLSLPIHLPRLETVKSLGGEISGKE
jgi:hypothetical protein